MNSSNQTRQNPTLVLGGTGKTGRRVAQRLTARGVPVRIGSRSGTPPFDWESPSTWGSALRDVRAAYVVYSPDLAAPGALQKIRSFTELAAARGVRRLVLLSGRGEEAAQRSEQAVRDSVLEWTILRASWFYQNFSESFLLDSVLHGEIALPVGPVPDPFVDAEDIADAAAAALTEDRHVGQVYELTGPRALTFADAAAEISRATGRDIRYVQMGREAYAAALTEHGVPGDYTDLLLYLFTTVLDGRNSHVGDGVQRALGRAPRDFADYVRDTAATGIWTSPANGPTPVA